MLYKFNALFSSSVNISGSHSDEVTTTENHSKASTNVTEGGAKKWVGIASLYAAVKTRRDIRIISVPSRITHGNKVSMGSLVWESDFLHFRPKPPRKVHRQDRASATVLEQMENDSKVALSAARCYPRPWLAKEDPAYDELVYTLRQMEIAKKANRKHRDSHVDLDPVQSKPHKWNAHHSCQNVSSVLHGRDYSSYTRFAKPYPPGHRPKELNTDEQIVSSRANSLYELMFPPSGTRVQKGSVVIQPYRRPFVSARTSANEEDVSNVISSESWMASQDIWDLRRVYRATNNVLITANAVLSELAESFFLEVVTESLQEELEKVIVETIGPLVEASSSVSTFARRILRPIASNLSKVCFNSLTCVY